MRSPHLLSDIRLLYAFRSSCPCESELINPYLISIIFLDVESASAGHIPRVKFHASSERKTLPQRTILISRRDCAAPQDSVLSSRTYVRDPDFSRRSKCQKSSLLTNRRSRLKPPRTRQFA